MVSVSLFPEMIFPQQPIALYSVTNSLGAFYYHSFINSITDLSYRLLCISNAVHSSYNMDIARPTTYRIDIRLLIIDI